MKSKIITIILSFILILTGPIYHLVLALVFPVFLPVNVSKNSQYYGPNNGKNPFAAAQGVGLILIGQGTWFVWGRMQESGVLKPDDPHILDSTFTGSATSENNQWLKRAEDAGYKTYTESKGNLNSYKPVAGDIVVWDHGVGFVEDVNSSGKPLVTTSNTIYTDDVLPTWAKKVVVTNLQESKGYGGVILRSEPGSSMSIASTVPTYSVLLIANPPSSKYKNPHKDPNNYFYWYYLSGNDSDGRSVSGWAALLKAEGDGISRKIVHSFTDLISEPTDLSSKKVIGYIHLKKDDPFKVEFERPQNNQTLSSPVTVKPKVVSGKLREITYKLDNSPINAPKDGSPFECKVSSGTHKLELTAKSMEDLESYDTVSFSVNSIDKIEVFISPLSDSKKSTEISKINILVKSSTFRGSVNIQADYSNTDLEVNFLRTNLSLSNGEDNTSAEVKMKDSKKGGTYNITIHANAGSPEEGSTNFNVTFTVPSNNDQKPSIAEIMAYIDEIANTYKIPSIIIKAMVEIESKYDVEAFGSDPNGQTHGFGLMQITFAADKNTPPGTRFALQVGNIASGVDRRTGESIYIAKRDSDIQIDIDDVRDWRNWRKNIEYGVKHLLAKKVISEGSTDNPCILENWYYPLWYYNGGGNNPRNPKFTRLGDPGGGTFPYQERVFNVINQKYPIPKERSSYFQKYDIVLPDDIYKQAGKVFCNGMKQDYIYFYSDNKASIAERGITNLYPAAVNPVGCKPPQDNKFHFPLSPAGDTSVNAYNTSATAIFDHTNTGSSYASDGSVQAFTGEIGDQEANCSDIGTVKICGYKKADKSAFFGKYPNLYASGNEIWYDGHPGWDYSGGNRTVYAVDSGEIVYAGWQDSGSHRVGFGQYVKIEHAGGYTTYYAHLSEIKVGLGIIEKGTVIGITGNTGNANGIHLHFEVKKNGIPVDPYGWEGSGADPYKKATNVKLWDYAPTQTDSCIDSNIPKNHWKGEFYNNRDLSGSPAMIKDCGSQDSLDMQFGRDNPAKKFGISCTINEDYFTARFTKAVSFSENGEYEFSVDSDDGCRIYVDGKTLIEEWKDVPASNKKKKDYISQGEHEIKVEYQETYGDAFIVFSWKKVGSSTQDSFLKIISPGKDFKWQIGSKPEVRWGWADYSKLPFNKGTIYANLYTINGEKVTQPLRPDNVGLIKFELASNMMPTQLTVKIPNVDPGKYKIGLELEESLFKKAPPVLSDIIEISETPGLNPCIWVRPEPTGTIPLLFVHGFTGEEKGLDRMITHLSSQNIFFKFTPYVYTYASGPVENYNLPGNIETTGLSLEDEISRLGIGDGRPLYIISHSMGGLVSRVFMQKTGPGKNVSRLITLGTPHHGTVFANLRPDTGDLSIGPIVNTLIQILRSGFVKQLIWDNYNNAAKRGENPWLEELNCVGSCLNYKFDKLFTYASKNPNVKTTRTLIGLTYGTYWLPRNNKENDGFIEFDSALFLGKAGIYNKPKVGARREFTRLDHLDLVEWPEDESDEIKKFILFDLMTPIDSISKNTSKIGDEITINGHGFGDIRGSSIIKFGEEIAVIKTDPTTSKECWSDTQIKVIVPNGSGKVKVIFVPSGNGNPSNSIDFEYIAAPPEPKKIYLDTTSKIIRVGGYCTIKAFTDDGPILPSFQIAFSQNGSGSGGQIDSDGKFTSWKSGNYMIIATMPGMSPGCIEITACDPDIPIVIPAEIRCKKGDKIPFSIIIRDKQNSQSLTDKLEINWQLMPEDLGSIDRTSNTFNARLNNGSDAGFIVASVEFEGSQPVTGSARIFIKDCEINKGMISPKNVKINKGESASFMLETFDDDGNLCQATDVVWKSSNLSVGFVENANDKTCTFKKVGIGKCEIMAFVDGKKLCNVTIESRCNPSKIEIFPNDIVVYGQEQKFEAFIYGESGICDSEDQVEWDYLPDDIGTLVRDINSNGRIITFLPKKCGLLELTAKCGSVKSETIKVQIESCACNIVYSKQNVIIETIGPGSERYKYDTIYFSSDKINTIFAIASDSPWIKTDPPRFEYKSRYKQKITIRVDTNYLPKNRIDDVPIIGYLTIREKSGKCPNIRIDVVCKRRGNYLFEFTNKSDIVKVTINGITKSENMKAKAVIYDSGTMYVPIKYLANKLNLIVNIKMPDITIQGCGKEVTMNVNDRTTIISAVPNLPSQDPPFEGPMPPLTEDPPIIQSSKDESNIKIAPDKTILVSIRSLFEAYDAEHGDIVPGKGKALVKFWPGWINQPSVTTHQRYFDLWSTFPI